MQVIERLVGLPNLPEGNVLKPGRKTLYGSADILDFMSNLRLEFPNIIHKEAYMDLLREWNASLDSAKNPGNLFYADTFEDFLSHIEKIRTLPEDGSVPSYLYFLIHGEKILGAIEIRTQFNQNNQERGGHIGYGIRPSERRKGYATIMLELALIEAKKFGLNEVLITCDDANIGSIRVIESNGGVFERYVDPAFGNARRYWIAL